MGIDTYQEPVVYMRADCHICKSEGFEAQSQVMIDCEKRDIVATLNVVHDQNAIDGFFAISPEPYRQLRALQVERCDLFHFFVLPCTFVY